jgi:Tfp pilus assembly protein PilV
MKDSEKRLLILSLGLLAIIGGLILSQKLRTWQRAIEMQETALAAERVDAAALLAEAPGWQQRGEWLARHQPVAQNDLDADNELFESLLSKAQTAGVSVVTKQFQEQVKTEFFQQAGVTLTVKGDLSNVFRWIYSVLSPGDFRVVPYLKITPDKDDAAKVVCAVQFWRWYQPPAAKPS